MSPDELRALVRALRMSAQSYAEQGREPPRAMLAELRTAEARLAEWDAGRAGPALGMPGVPWDAYRNAWDPVPLRAAMPASLPGGRWGAGTTRLTITTDAQGAVVGGRSDPALPGFLFHDFPTASAELARGEWPIPTVWALQGSVDVTTRSGGDNPRQPPAFPTNWTLVGRIEQSVENSTIRLPIVVTTDGPFPLIQGITFQNPIFGVWTANFVAQQIKVVIDHLITTDFTDTPFGTWNYGVTALLGLQAASLPPTREGTAR